MTTITMTTRDALAHLVAGIRGIPDDWSGIGHQSGKTTVRAEAARRMIAAVRPLADQIEAATDDEAIRLIAAHRGLLTNIDPHGAYIGRWAHVATMISLGKRYEVVNGVLCSCV